MRVFPTSPNAGGIRRRFLWPALVLALALAFAPVFLPGLVAMGVPVSGQSLSLQGVSMSPVAVDVAAGPNHALILDGTGAVWSVGENASGQMGTGTTKASPDPIRIHDPSTGGMVRSIAAGDAHSLMLMQDGSVMAFGANTRSMLSVGSTEARVTRPMPVLGPEALPLLSVRGIAAGSVYSAVWFEDGSARLFGRDLAMTSLGTAAGPLGQVRMVAMNAQDVVVILEDGTGYAGPVTSPGQLALLVDTEGFPVGNLVLADAGDDFFVALNRFGQALTWGRTYSNALGRPEGIHPTELPYPAVLADTVTALKDSRVMSCGSDHTLTVNVTGTLYGWGSGTDGRIDPARTNQFQVATPFTVTGLSGVKALACGGRQSLAIDGLGRVWRWGRSNGPSAPHILPLQVRLWLTATPKISVSKIEYDKVQISWDPADLDARYLRGYTVQWTRPDGATATSMLLPADIRSLTIYQLQPGTNHDIVLSAVGEGGAAQAAPVVTVQTKEEPTPTPVPSGEETPTPEGTVTGQPSITAKPTATGPADPSASPTSDPLPGGNIAEWLQDVLPTIILGLAALAALLVIISVVAGLVSRLRHSEPVEILEERRGPGSRRASGWSATGEAEEVGGIGEEGESDTEPDDETSSDREEPSEPPVRPWRGK